jgi:hypothetical protein
VRGIDGTSRNSQRPALIACGLQVRKHLVERISDEARHILSNDPSGLGVEHSKAHFRPEVAVICRALALSGETERLARESAAEEIDGFDLSPVNSSDVSVSLDVGPVLGEHSVAVGVDFNLPFDFKACPL